MSKLTDLAKHYVNKKTEFDESVKKANAIKITDISNLVKKTDYNTKINKIEKKLLIMIMINISLQKNLISLLQNILLQG